MTTTARAPRRQRLEVRVARGARRERAPAASRSIATSAGDDRPRRRRALRATGPPRSEVARQEPVARTPHRARNELENAPRHGSASTILASTSLAADRVLTRHRAAAYAPRSVVLALALAVVLFAHSQPAPPDRRPAQRRADRARPAHWAWSAACSTSPPTPTTRTRALLAYLANDELRARRLSVAHARRRRPEPDRRRAGPLLGLIRTQELLAARRIDGAEQFFTRARDFGYSKSPEETLRIWGKDAVLADVVSVIRRFRPDVIITRFSPEPAETHGHHTASAMLALEAFQAAADPQFHPEQLARGVGAWQARRIVWNRRRSAIKPSETCRGDIKLDVGGYNPLLGESYGEIAADSRSMHKSQGFGVARTAGRRRVFQAARGGRCEGGGEAKPLAGSAGASLCRWSCFAGRGAAQLRGADRKAIAKVRGVQPRRRRCPRWSRSTARSDGMLRRRLARGQAARGARSNGACAGLFVDATAADYRAAPGTAVEVTATPSTARRRR